MLECDGEFSNFERMLLIKNTLWFKFRKALVRRYFHLLAKFDTVASFILALDNIRAVASGGGARGEIVSPSQQTIFLKRPNLGARLRADSFLSSFSKLESREMHF